MTSVSFREAATAFEDKLGAYYPDSLHEHRFILIGCSHANATCDQRSVDAPWATRQGVEPNVDRQVGAAAGGALEAVRTYRTLEAPEPASGDARGASRLAPPSELKRREAKGHVHAGKPHTSTSRCAG